MNNDINYYFDDYDFLSLYCFTKVIKGDSREIDNELLGNVLFYYYDDPRYSALFDEISLDRDGDIVFVDLHRAFAYAYSSGLLDLKADDNGVKTIINASKEESELFLNNFRKENVDAMSRLYDDAKKKEPILSKLIELKKIETEIRLAKQLIEVNKQIQQELEEEIQKELETKQGVEMHRRIRKKDTNI